MLGRPIGARRSSPTSQVLRPLSRTTASARSMSIVVGTDRQPFHTDSAHLRNPPRYLLFRALSPSTTPTLLVDFQALLLSQDELTLLSREVWVVNGGRGRFLTSIASHHPLIVRFDPNVMRPAHPNYGSSRLVLERACGARPPLGVTWPIAQVLVIDNWRVLHARERVSASDSARALERVHVEATI